MRHTSWRVFCRHVGGDPCRDSYGNYAPWHRLDKKRAREQAVTHHEASGHPCELVRVTFETVEWVR